MKRKVHQNGNTLALELTAELRRIGASDTVLVRVEEGDNPRIIISLPPTFEEAAKATLENHSEALRQLSRMPAAGTENTVA